MNSGSMMGKGGMMGMGGMMSGGMMSMMSKGSMMSGGMMNPEMCIKNAQKIGLSDDQLKEFKSLHFEKSKELITLNAQKDIKQLELDTFTGADDLDLTNIEHKLSDLYQTKVQIKMVHFKTHKKVKELLTKEQMKKMKNLMMEGMMQMKGAMMGGNSMMGDQGMPEKAEKSVSDDEHTSHHPGTSNRGDSKKMSTDDIEMDKGE